MRQAALDFSAPAEPRPWKRTSVVSRELCQRHVRTGTLRRRQEQTLRCLMALYNRTNRGVTAEELEIYMLAREEFHDPRDFQVRARLNELADGHWTTTKLQDGTAVRRRIGGGLVERVRDARGRLVKRKTVIQDVEVGLMAVLTWRPRERGSEEAGPSNAVWVEESAFDVDQ